MTDGVAQLGLVLDCADPNTSPCSEHGSTWLLMSDPEGNEFCVCDGGQNSSTP